MLHNFNTLHLHMYNVGILSLATMQQYYPGETTTTIGSALTKYKQLHG